MIHVFFCPPAAATFRQLLAARGISDEVAFLSDSLDFGPIFLEDLAGREAWLNENVPMDWGDYDWLAQTEASFRKHIADDPERLIWIAPASAMEQAGLYWFLKQFGGTGVKLAIADFPLTESFNGQSPLTLGELPMKSMGRLYDECPRVPWDPCRFPENRWSTLTAENALVRVIADGRLQSAPDDYFDGFLLARCPTNWTRFYQVIGYTMADIWDTGQVANSDFLLWRLRKLIETNQINCDGKLPFLGENLADAVRISRSA